MSIRQAPADSAVKPPRRKNGRFRERDCHELRRTVDKVDVEAVTVRLEDRVRGRLRKPLDLRPRPRPRVEPQAFPTGSRLLRVLPTSVERGPLGLPCRG